MVFSNGGYRGRAKEIIVIRDATLKMIIDITELYLEKDNIVINAKAQSRIRKKSPKPIPKTLGPSSTNIFSSF